LINRENREKTQGNNSKKLVLIKKSKKEITGMMKKMVMLAALTAAVLTGCSASAANGNAETKAATTAAATEAATTEAAATETAASEAEETTGKEAEAEAPVEADANWPAENITFYVPGAAGGSTDMAARLITDYIQKVTGGTVVVMDENTGGGAVMLETLRTTDNPNYTLGLVGSQGINLVQTGAYEYDVRDESQFTIINRVITGAHANSLTCGKNAPFSDFDGLIEYAKAHPGEVRAVQTTGTLSQVYLNMIQKEFGVEFKILEAKSNEQVTNVVGGMADIFVTSYNTLEGYDGTGELVPILFIDVDREEKYPDVPSFTDIGLADKLAKGGQFVIASAGMDPAVVARLNELLADIGSDEDAVKRAETTNNVLDVLDQKASMEMYKKTFDLYQSVRE